MVSDERFIILSVEKFEEFVHYWMLPEASLRVRDSSIWTLRAHGRETKATSAQMEMGHKHIVDSDRVPF